MNPYERRIVHSAVSEMEGVRSESTGEGIDRRVVIYSTAPDANNRLPRSRGPRRDGERRDDRRSGKGGRRDGRRDDRRGKGGPKGPRSSVPAREFADRPRDENAQPTAPRRTERIDDAADFAPVREDRVISQSGGTTSPQTPEIMAETIRPWGIIKK